MNDYKYNLAFAAIVKNESPYIEEWIKFHQLVGVEKFYIYDNDSEDELKEKLQSYIDTGLVEYTYFPGIKMQVEAYKDATKKHKEECKYLGFIDLDEFVIPVENKNLVESLDEIMALNENAAGVAINWRIYGSSGLVEKQDGLVIENYRYRAENDFKVNNHIKTICNPRMVEDIKKSHFPKYKEGMYNINENGTPVLGPFNPNGSCKKIRINHYFTKSKEEYIAKMNRGKADALDKRNIEEFYAHDKNAVYDYIMEPYVELLKEVIASSCEYEEIK